MMPRTVEVTLFDINELSEEAKARAINTIRERDYFGVLPEHITERFAEVLTEHGLPTDDVEWRLSHSQGDGVAFYGSMDGDDIKKLLEKVLGDSKRIFIDHFELSAEIVRNAYGNHYSHYNTMQVFMERGKEYTTQNTKLAGKMIWDTIAETVVSVSRQLEKIGYEMVEANQTDEYIVEMCEVNEMQFREDGAIWHG